MTIKLDTATTADIPALIDLLEILFSIEQDFSCNRSKQSKGLALLLQQHNSAHVAVTRHDKDGIVGGRMGSGPSPPCHRNSLIKVDLTRIDVTTALAVISKTGADMSRFATVGQGRSARIAPVQADRCILDHGLPTACCARCGRSKGDLDGDLSVGGFRGGCCYLAALNAAEQSVRMMSPYFIPDATPVPRQSRFI
ncbi:MAG: hypothetical protein ACYDCX_01030 [Acidithiobacillus sp.]